MPKPLIVILGPTSSGKTKLAVALARKFNGEIVSADSRQVYRGMDIGTGKDLKEYGVPFDSPAKAGSLREYCLSLPAPYRTCSGAGSKAFVPYHLIDVANPKTQFSVGQYQKLAYRAIDDILRRGKVPFLVGGTGLYIRAIVDGLVFPQAKANPKLRQKLSRLNLHSLLTLLKRLDLKTYKEIDRKNRRRVERALEICLLTSHPLSQQRQKNPPPYDILQIGIAVPKEKLFKKIDTRLRQRLEKEGLIKEVKQLHKQGLSWKKLDQFGLEYRFVSRYLRGQLTYSEMFEQLSHAIKDFAKRQMTWFKRDKKIHWITHQRHAQILIYSHLKNNFLLKK